ncbi:MAG: 5-methyltetrahydropteroyltriglutamate--homocysteine S-methyltransferase [Candidatus Sulfotelmatobacter sp.]
MAVVTANLGFPRIGTHRQLKFALEQFWSGNGEADQLQATAREIRKAHWQLQADAGIDQIPSNDFSLYDHVLDTAVLLGAVPGRYGRQPERVELDTYFKMARGGNSVPAMEMTKWFDTNYHYIVPEFEPGMNFRVASCKPIEEFLEAKALGLMTRPVLLGPISFVLLSKSRSQPFDRWTIVKAILEVYSEVLRDLAHAGAAWVQMDEPCLGLDLTEADLALFGKVYEPLVSCVPGLKILVATYFSGLEKNLHAALRLPVAGLHLDLVRAPDQLLAALDEMPPNLTVSLGLVDGRGVWRTNLDRALKLAQAAVNRSGPDRVQIAPSCSLLHVPVDLDEESNLDPQIRNWLAFAKQKLAEVKLLARAVTDASLEFAGQFRENRQVLAERRKAQRVYDPAVRKRVAAIVPGMFDRPSNSAVRATRLSRVTPLPLLPVTTIGSFPQTREVRQARAAYRSGTLSQTQYEDLLRNEIKRAIRIQEEIGLDVLVHGEFERNDMVEYFAEQLNGFLLTSNGWVQSYGSRCVKPPILFGDVSRPQPMTVAWAVYAQSLTKLPVKGMLTGPVTMLEWSFVRDDLTRGEVCFQIALALRDEVKDLESAGIRVIQVDEPALREGLPLRKAAHSEYLQWSVDAFRLVTAVASDEIQIHTHMCYSEFREILDVLKRMDADVISIEAARSEMELLNEFTGKDYPNNIGPGVYDIHSPRIPSSEEVEARVGKALRVFRQDRLWVNPDCGLKTRRWEEVRGALINMVAAARRLRQHI